MLSLQVKSSANEIAHAPAVETSMSLALEHIELFDSVGSAGMVDCICNTSCKLLPLMLLAIVILQLHPHIGVCGGGEWYRA